MGEALAGAPIRTDSRKRQKSTTRTASSRISRRGAIGEVSKSGMSMTGTLTAAEPVPRRPGEGGATTFWVLEASLRVVEVLVLQHRVFVAALGAALQVGLADEHVVVDRRLAVLGDRLESPST